MESKRYIFDSVEEILVEPDSTKLVTCNINTYNFDLNKSKCLCNTHVDKLPITKHGMKQQVHSFILIPC